MTFTMDTTDRPTHAGAFTFRSAEPRREKPSRLLARGQKISHELEAFAAASRERLAAIDIEYPEQPEFSGATP